MCGFTPQNRANFADLSTASRLLGFSLDVAFEELSPDIKDYVLYGPNKAQRDVLGMPDFEGVIAQLEKKWKRTTSEAVKNGMRVLRRTIV